MRILFPVLTLGPVLFPGVGGFCSVGPPPPPSPVKPVLQVAAAVHFTRRSWWERNTFFSSQFLAYALKTLSTKFARWISLAFLPDNSESPKSFEIRNVWRVAKTIFHGMTFHMAMSKEVIAILISCKDSNSFGVVFVGHFSTFVNCFLGKHYTGQMPGIWFVDFPRALGGMRSPIPIDTTL